MSAINKKMLSEYFSKRQKKNLGLANDLANVKK